MPPAANTDWERLISLFGLPLILLVLIAVCAWKFIRWCRPHVERVITAHVGLLTTCSETLVKLESSAAKGSEKIDKLAEHTLVITAHVGLLTTCSATLVKLENNSTQSSEKIEELASHTLDPRGPCQRSNMALVSASRAFDALAKHDPAVQEHTNQMRQSLLEG